VEQESQDSRVPVPVESHTLQETPAHGYYYPYPSYPTSAAGYDDGGEALDWRRLLDVVWSRKWLIIGVTAAATTAAIVIAPTIVKPVYSVRSTIWLDESARRGGAITSEDVLEGEGWADLMRSYAVLGPVVMTEGLYAEPQEPSGADRSWFANLAVTDSLIPGTYELYLENNGYRLVRDGEGLVETGRLGSQIGGSSGFHWRPDQRRLDGIEALRFDLLSPRFAALNLRTNLRAGFNKEASLITATLTWSDPDEAAEILNGVVGRLVTTATELKNRKQAEIVDILEQQTLYAAAQLRERELDLESYRVATATEPTDLHATPIPGAAQTRSGVFDAYFEQRLEARRLQADVEQLETLLATSGPDGVNDLALQQVPAVSLDPDLETALDELYEQEANRRALLYTYTQQHPDVQDVALKISELRSMTIPAMISALIVELGDRSQLLDEQMTAQAGELRQIPARAIEDTRREREFELAEDLHNRLLTSLREAKLAAATSLPDLQVVDAAFRPFKPLSNEAPRLVIMVAMASFGLTVGGVLLHDRMDRRIQTPDQITRRLGLPVLGIVPRLESTGESDSTRAAVAIESFRAIRTQLAHSAPEEPRVVLITSPAPRDGKSMVAANLAISYAAAGRNTILVDADTRRGKAEQMFGLLRSPGLSDYLLGRAELTDAEQSTEIDNLALLPRGDHTGFSVELLDSDRMRELLALLADRYDNVVLDAPPLAAGADTLILGQLADKVVVVFRAGETDEGMALAKMGTVGNVELPFAGAVLNAVPEKAHYYSYYASHYYVDAAG
jgi:capsular exopolysaccharide synthesis family protein